MKFDWIWKCVLIFFIGTFILRVSGRRSISQMTISQTAVMIGLGSLIVNPIEERGILITFLEGVLLAILMVATEYLAFKVDFIETLMSGKAVIVIEDGKVNMKNMKKLRLTVDKLEMRMRQVGISSIDDVKYATIEASGQIGYELKKEKQPLTRADFVELMSEINEIKKLMKTDKKPQSNKSTGKSSGNDIFEEIKCKKFEGRNEP